MDINMEKITWRDKEIIRFLSALDTVRTSNHDIKCVCIVRVVQYKIVQSECIKFFVSDSGYFLVRLLSTWRCIFQYHNS